MPTPYQFTPRVPAAPHSTPGSDYKLPSVKSTRPPAQNPYEKFTQPEFDAWIGGITSALKRALGQEEEDEEHPKLDKSDPENFVHTQPNLFDDATELFDEHIEDSFAEVKARRAAGKGKARDPREGPGLRKGESSNPIYLGSSDEEDAEEVEMTITADYGSESDDEDGGVLSDEEYSWQKDQLSSPPAPSSSRTDLSKFTRHNNEENGYGSEEDEDEEKSDEEHLQYEEYDEEYEEDEVYAQSSPPEVIDLSSDDDEVEEDLSENEEPPRKIRKVLPQRRFEEEEEAIWSDGEGEIDEDFEEEQPTQEVSSTKLSKRVEGEHERQHSHEIIALDSDEGQSDQEKPSKHSDAQQVEVEELFDDDIREDIREDEDEEYEEEHKENENDKETYQIAPFNDRMSSMHDQHEYVQANDDNDDEIQPLGDDTSFLPKSPGSPFKENIPEIPDPWSGPRTYAEDFYSGGDVQIPLSETVNAHHLGPSDGDLTTDPVLHQNFGDGLVQPIEENTAFPPSSDHPAAVDISDPWKGPQLYAEDFYSGGPVQHHGGLATAHYLGPTDVDTSNELAHNTTTQEQGVKDDEQMQPQEANTSFPQGVEESEGVIDIADPWTGPRTFAEDYYSGGDVRTLPGVPIDPALLAGTAEVEDDIDSFLTPGAVTPSQTKESNDLESESENDQQDGIIQLPEIEERVSSSVTRRNKPIPKDAEIIAIDDSDEEQDPLVTDEELDGHEEFGDEVDNLSFQYPDFGEGYPPPGMEIEEEIEEDELDSDEVIMAPLQAQEDENDNRPDIDTMNYQFEYVDNVISQSLDANISVTVGHKEVEEKTELQTDQELSKDGASEIQRLEEPQDNSITMEDEAGTATFHTPPFEQDAITALGVGQIGLPSSNVLEDKDSMNDGLERNVEVPSSLTGENDIPYEGSKPSGLASVFDAHDEQQLSESVAEVEKEAIPSVPSVDVTEDDHMLLPPSSVPASPPTPTSGQLPTPPSEKNRYVSLPPESRDELIVESCSVDIQQVKEANAVTVSTDNLSQATEHVDIIEHTVAETTKYELEKDADGMTENVGDDIDIRTAYTGEDVDDLQFSVEETTTEGCLTAEPPEREMSLGVVSLPSEETETARYDEDIETLQVSAHTEAMAIETSTVPLTQISQTDIGVAKSATEKIEHLDGELTSKISEGGGEIVIPVNVDPNVVESVNQTTTPNLDLSTDRPTDSLLSEGKEIEASSLENVTKVLDEKSSLDRPSTPADLSTESSDDDSTIQQAPIQIVQQYWKESDSLAHGPHALRNEPPPFLTHTAVPTDDVFGTDGQETPPSSLPHQVPSSFSRTVTLRQPTDPVLMSDPYPYCLSTPNVPLFPRPVNHEEGGATSSQIDQGIDNDTSRNNNVVPGSQGDLLVVAPEEELIAEATSLPPRRKRKRKTASVKSATPVSSRQTPTIELGDKTSPSVAESPRKDSATEVNAKTKKRTKERKAGPSNKGKSSKKNTVDNILETTSQETILVNPRLEGQQGESSQQTNPGTSIQEESTVRPSVTGAHKIFPPGNTSAVVSPAPSNRSFTSQPSPTLNKPNVFPHPIVASESLLHAHGQKRKAMLTQTVQQSKSPRTQPKLPQLSRFPSAPLIGTNQPSISASVISPIDATKPPALPPPASIISPIEKPSVLTPAKPVTPIPKSNSMSSRPSTRSTPVTRSHCRYHRVSLPKEEGGPRVSFLVPGCSLNDKELMDEEEIVDHGDATVDDSRNMLKDIETLGFSLDLIGVLRQLVGLDILREGEIFYLPQPGEVVTRRIPLQRSASTIRAPVDGSSHAGSPGSSGFVFASPGPNRPPHSSSSWSESPSISSLLRQPPAVPGSGQAGTDGGYISSEQDFETDTDSGDVDPNGKLRPSSTATTSKAKGNQARKSKAHKGVDLTYEPEDDHDDEESDPATSPRKRRKSIRGTKRNRDSDAIPINDDDGQEREAKKPKIQMDTLPEATTPAQPHNPSI